MSLNFYHGYGGHGPGVKISLRDNVANVHIATIEITPEDWIGLSASLSDVKVDVGMYNLNKINRRMVHKDFEFELPTTVNELFYEERKQETAKLAEELCPDGWESDGYFDSQGSFFIRDGKPHARCIIRKWGED